MITTSTDMIFQEEKKYSLEDMHEYGTRCYKAGQKKAKEQCIDLLLKEFAPFLSGTQMLQAMNKFSKFKES
jgi:hypothetical protein